MFEDAYLSGALCLRSRKIKDFPAHLCAKHDLSDLISADLSLNRLNELPACMCELESLETLQLRSNCIQRLPSTIHLLKSLSFLDLSGNHIQTIPPTLFFLRLKVLLLGGNKISTIPREIRQLENCLLELDLSYNRLIELPTDLTLLKTLKILNLSNNQLITLPEDMGLMQLRSLNVEENCLTALPLDFFNLSPFLIYLKVDGNPFVSPPVNVILKGREHIFKWLRTQFNFESDQNSKDWNFNRCSTINATLRRPDKILVQSQLLPKSSDPTTTLRKVERRPRQNRFATVGGGTDSGYASTGDENRLSHEMIMSKGSLEEIHEISSSLPSSNQDAGGDLVQEVMLACEERLMERKMALRGSPLSPHSAITSPTTAAAMDVSNNNIPSKSIEIPKAAPKAAMEEASDESQTSDIDSESSPKLQNPSPPLSDSSTSGSETSEPLIKSKVSTTISKPVLTKSSITKSSSIRSSTTPPESKPPTTIKRTTVSRIQPSLSRTVVVSKSAATTTTSSGIKKPSLSTSRITPAPSTASLIPPRKSDPTQSKSASSRPLAASTINLSKVKSIDATTNGIARKAPLNGMSKSAISGCSTLPRKPASQIGTSPTSLSASVVDSMKKVIEGKLIGLKLPSEKDRIAQELSSGVHLCNFINKIRSRSISTVFTPTEAILSPLKAKRNADGFVAASKRLGVPENSLCTSADILERTNLSQIARTVLALNKLALSNGSQITTVASRV